MKGVFEDIRHALRLYRRTPGASLMIIAVLAIGMAFVAAFLSLYSDLVLRPQPGFEKGGGRIVSVGMSNGRNYTSGMPYELIERIAEESTTLQHLAGVTRQGFTATDDGAAVVGEMVTREFFSGLRPQLALGEGFTPDQHGADGEPVVVISWQYWQDKFGGRSDVLGRTIRLEGEGAQMMLPDQAGKQPTEQEKQEYTRDFRIVGVMGREYTGMQSNVPEESRVRLWMPMEIGIPLGAPPPGNASAVSLMGQLTMRAIGRLKPGASANAAVRELNGRYGQEEFLRRRPGAKYDVADRIVENIYIQRDTERQLQLFLGASVLLALVAAANVSLFLLARAPTRRRELGIRMAVGAPLARLARQLASEAAVLVVVGAVLGLALSMWLARFLRGLSFLRSAQWRDVTLLDWRVLVLVGVFLLLLTALVSLAPILGLKQLGIAASSRQVAARATVAQRIAGTAQIAAAGVLGAAAIAFAGHLALMLWAWPGFRTDLYAVSWQINFGKGPIRVENGRIVGVVDAARRQDAFAGIPGITKVAMGSSAPGMPGFANSSIVPDPNAPDDPQAQIRYNILVIDNNYVQLLGRRMLPGGRHLTAGESGAVLVNQAFARRFFGRDDVVGEALPTRGRNGAQPVQIVGVLEDVSYGHPLADHELAVFTTASDNIVYGGNIIFESTLPVAGFQKQFKDVASSLDLLLVNDVVSLREARRNVLAADRARGLLTIATAGLVVLLAAFGFYGTQRYLVSAGRREYAIRASLGAGPKALGRMVFRRGMLLGVPGVVLAVPGAFLIVSWLRGDYVAREISPLIVAAVVVLALIVLLLAASMGPARLARRTQPAPLLRED